MARTRAKNLRILAAWLLVSAFLAPGADCRASAAEPLRVDFEQGEDVSQYEHLDWGSLEAAVVPRGVDGEGHCLRLRNTAPAGSCGVRLKGPLTLTKNLKLSFDYRTEIEPGFEGAYLGMIFYVDGTQWFWQSDAFSVEWRHAEVSLGGLHSGPYFAGHQHPDQNSFVIHAYGEKLAIDGGYYDWYGSPHFKAYSMTTLAHNTLLVDGAGQAVCKSGADGRITSYFDSPSYGYSVGDASDPEIYDGKLSRFDRRVLFIKPDFVVVHDLVATTSGTARYDWMLHAVEPVDGYSTRPVPPEKYVPEWHLYATPKQAAPQEEFLAAMQIQRLDEQPEPEAAIEPVEATGAHGVRIRAGDRTHLIVSRKADADGLIRCDGLETDGEVAAVEFGRDGSVLGAMAIGARELRYNGQMLLDEDTPQDWVKPFSESGSQ